MQRQGAAHAGAYAPRLRARDAEPLLAADPAQQAVGLELADRFPDGRAIDAELPRQIHFGGQGVAGAQRAGDDALLDDVRDLAVRRMIVEGCEQIGHYLLSHDT